jgi:hypothetical protein
MEASVSPDGVHHILKKFPSSASFGDKILSVEHLENLQPLQQRFLKRVQGESA